MNENKKRNNMKKEIQKILDRNFTKSDNAKALNELCVLFDISNNEVELCDCGKQSVYYLNGKHYCDDCIENGLKV
jgi:hypothetical protein